MKMWVRISAWRRSWGWGWDYGWRNVTMTAKAWAGSWRMSLVLAEPIARAWLRGGEKSETIV
jgi:hypothetical protein